MICLYSLWLCRCYIVVMTTFSFLIRFSLLLVVIALLSSVKNLVLDSFSLMQNSSQCFRYSYNFIFLESSFIGIFWTSPTQMVYFHTGAQYHLGVSLYHLPRDYLHFSFMLDFLFCMSFSFLNYLWSCWNIIFFSKKACIEWKFLEKLWWSHSAFRLPAYLW